MGDVGGERRACTAGRPWNDGGVEAILPYLDPGVEWHPPQESMEPGTYHGHAGVREYLGRLGEVFGERRVETLDVIEVDAERVISVVRLIARSEKFATEIDAEWGWLIKIRDAKAVEVRLFTDRARALEAAGQYRAG
jgi:uncharacterized protein